MKRNNDIFTDIFKTKLFFIYDSTNTLKESNFIFLKNVRDITNEIDKYETTTGIIFEFIHVSESSSVCLFVFDYQIIIITENDLLETPQFIGKILEKPPIFYIDNQSELKYNEIISKRLKTSKKEPISKINEIITKKILDQIVNCIIKKSQIRTQNRYYKSKNEFLKNNFNFKKDDFIIISQLTSTNPVFLVFNIRDQFLYIMKCFDKRIQTSFHRYEHEKSFYEKCNNLNPFICKYYGETEYDDFIYFFIEYIEGYTIHEIIKNKIIKLDKDDKIKILIEISCAVECLHFNNIIYRDLKSENIIIDSEKNAILIDFDSSKFVDNSEMTSDIGSNLFASPEQLSSNDYSFEADIYSIGILFHYILTEDSDLIMKRKVTFDDDDEIKEKIIEFDNFYEYYKKCFNEQPKLRPTIIDICNNFLYFYTTNQPFCLKIINIREKLTTIQKISLNKNKFLCELAKFLIYCYYNGVYVEKNSNKILYYITILENQDDSTALEFIGNIYIEGTYIRRDIEKAIHYFTLSANLNNQFSQLKLGQIYLGDKYIPLDINKSIYYFTKSANQNNSEAQYYLGEIYYEGKHIKRDINKAIHYLTLSADQNNSGAQWYLGYSYFCNEDMPRNINKAIHYLTLSANQNNPIGQYYLGKIYYNGQYIRRDIDKGIYYLTLSAKQNYLEAQWFLGSEYLLGINIPQDIDKAIYYLTFAADQNDSLAQYQLGAIYLVGHKCKQNIPKAIHYFTLSADQNNSNSLYILYELYFYGIHIKQDINKAIYYLKRSADLNFSVAQFILSCTYFEGKYIPQDINKGIHYLKLSADQNDRISQYYLGLSYYKGIYIKQNINKAIYYLTFSAEKDYSDAQFLLGQIYYDGMYVQQDIKKSIFYFKESSSFNNQYAKNNLGIIYKNGNGVDKNIYFSIEYFEEAIKQNSDSYSMYNLARIYYFGIEIEPNIPKAIEILESLSELSYEANIFLFYIYFISKEKSINENKINHNNNLKKILDVKYHFKLIYNNFQNKTIFNQRIFIFLKEYDLIYSDNTNYMFNFTNFVLTGSPEYLKSLKKQEQKIKQKNIDRNFYKGFYS